MPCGGCGGSPQGSFIHHRAFIVGWLANREGPLDLQRKKKFCATNLRYGMANDEKVFQSKHW